jgi:hypothetical protein
MLGAGAQSSFGLSRVSTQSIQPIKKADIILRSLFVLSDPESRHPTQVHKGLLIDEA